MYIRATYKSKILKLQKIEYFRLSSRRQTQNILIYSSYLHFSNHAFFITKITFFIELRFFN